MPRLDANHWLVAQGDTWATISTAVGVTRNNLILADGQKVSITTQPPVGSVLHLPLVGP